MFSGKLVINKNDRKRLQQVVDSARRSWSTYGPYLDWLNEQLEQAHACESSEVPGDLVTMNSQVELKDLRSGTTRTATLVYPGADDCGDGDSVSVFEPTGLALLGSRVGDVLGWSDPDRSHTAHVAKLRYQPEAAGDLDL